MFRNFKIRINLILIVVLIFLHQNKAYGISPDFKYVIDTIGIPQYNVYGEEINEDVYYTYNVISYSTPESASVGASQGFKSVNGGLWSSSGGKYIGVGQAGEYYFVGRAYNGTLISNVRYPVSFFPETTPNHWNYVEVASAAKSWNDTTKYKYKEQLSYMKNTSILYDRLDFVNRVTNPYDLVEYGISASNIGLNKITLDACATWKTSGVLTAVRRESTGAIRYAIFATKPMAASASVKSDLKCKDSYEISNEEKTKNVEISFGAHVDELNDYAKKEHIKEIKAELYINGELKSSVSASKKESVKKNYIITLDRSKANSYPLYIEVKTSLYTEFAVDGLMRDGLSKNVNVIIAEYKEKVKDADIKILSKKGSKYFVSDMIKTNDTILNNSKGIIQGKNHMCIRVNTDYNFEDISILLNGKKQEFSQIYSKDNIFYIDYKVPASEEFISINSWNFLRNKNNNYFYIDHSKVGSRVKKPNVLKVCINGEEKKFLFDIIDKYNLNINYDLPSVINGKEIENKIDIEKW